MSPSKATTALHPRLGVGVFIIRPITSTSTTSTSTSNPNSTASSNTPEFILGLRHGSHGANTWALPGGHLELNESFETCATREVLEETGLSVTNVRFLTATNDIMETEAKHYVTVFVVAELDAEGPREPEVCEPLKCKGWEWVTWEKILKWAEGEGERRELFLPLVNLVRTRPGVVPGLV